MYLTYGLRAAGEKVPWQFSPAIESKTRKEAALVRNKLLTPDADGSKPWPNTITKFPSGRLVYQSIPCSIS